MILGHVNQLEADRPILAAALAKGVEYLKNTDFATVEVGRYEIDGNAMFALVQEVQTSPKSERRAEAHAKYIDIQFIYRGKEAIGFALPNAANEVSEDLLEAKDNIFYKSVQGEMELVLSDGMYAVFFPNEVHRPCCNVGQGSFVKKVVLKIAVNLVK